MTAAKPGPTLDDLPEGVIRTPEDQRLWDKTADWLKDWAVREAQDVLDEYGPQTVGTICGILLTGR